MPGSASVPSTEAAVARKADHDGAAPSGSGVRSSGTRRCYPRQFYRTPAWIGIPPGGSARGAKHEKPAAQRPLADEFGGQVGRSPPPRHVRTLAPSARARPVARQGPVARRGPVARLGRVPQTASTTMTRVAGSRGGPLGARNLAQHKETVATHGAIAVVLGTPKVLLEVLAEAGADEPRLGPVRRPPPLYPQSRGPSPRRRGPWAALTRGSTVPGPQPGAASPERLGRRSPGASQRRLLCWCGH